MKPIGVETTGRVKVQRLVEAMAVLAVLAVTVCVYRGAFAGFFVADDFGWLESSRFRSLGDYSRIFFRFNPALVYRPLSQETFFCLGQKAFGLSPPGFHIVSVLFHLLCAVLVYLLARKFCPVIPSIVGTFVFAVHSALMSPVYWISALPEPMALTFILSAFLLFIRFDRNRERAAYILSIGAMGLGMMSKESTLALPAVLAAYCLFFSRSRLRWTLPFFAISVLYATLRLTSRVVAAAPYPLTFGPEVVGNLAAYFSWSAGFSDTLLFVKLGLVPEKWYPLAALGFFAVVAVLLSLARDKRTAWFAAVCYAVSIQPVLYFRDHIDPYYLAPALAALALLVAAALPDPRQVRDRRAMVPAIVLVCYTAWIAPVSIRLEGKWRNERTMVGKRILDQMPAIDRQVPKGRLAYLLGFSESELGILGGGVAFQAFGYSWARYVPIGVDPDTLRQIRVLHMNGSIRNCYCFRYDRGELIDVTAEFRRNPQHFIPPLILRISPTEIQSGRDTMILEVPGLGAESIDIKYTLDGKPLPTINAWRLDRNARASVFVDSATAKGLYHFVAVRDSRSSDPSCWYPVDVSVAVR